LARGWTAENAPRPPDPPKRKRGADGVLSTEKTPELAVLAAALPRKDERLERDDPLEELAALAKTAGVNVVPPRVVQRRDRLDSATCVGKGTVTRIQELLDEHGASVVIFDNDLTPGQRRNLEKRLTKKVIDRTELILDIFASHARTPQSRLQVEVAQLEYSLPRLRRMWSHLDPGVGLRGPGEKQLEIDKRLVRVRIQELKRELAKVRARRERQVQGRSEVFTVALVGYTNAGKSTLMNRRTEADVYVEDKLFATLDTRTRPWKVGSRRAVLLSDTVGFIRHLPHHLVESFHATLEEVVTADLLLHVVDASDPSPLSQVEAVREVLKALGVHERPELVVLNKIDRCEPEFLPWLEQNLVNTVRVSAKTGEGADALMAKVNSIASAEEHDYRLAVDVREGKAIAALEGYAEVLEKTLDGETLRFHVQCRPQVLAAVRASLRDPAGLEVDAEPEGDTAAD
jgi:GTP-binding protein HflX